MRTFERPLGFIAVALVLSTTTLGCELLAKPDRDKIPTGETTATTTSGAGGRTTTTGANGGAGGHGTGGSGGVGGQGTGGQATGGHGGQGTGGQGTGGHGGIGGQGTGGHGGGGECSVPGDCPGVDTECGARTCEGGACGTKLAADGVALAQQSAGNCQVVVCDGQGATQSVDRRAHV